MESTAIKVWGDAQEGAVKQMEALMEFGDVYDAALMADHHLGYSQPIGGVVAYRGMVSPSGVGFDIACGNKAVKTGLVYNDIKDRTVPIADAIFNKVEFGIGRNRSTRAEHALFDDTASWEVLAHFAGGAITQKLKDRARNQLGTVGSGNHYVDVFAESDAAGNIYHDSPIWIGVHFGSRGLGHNIATGFLKMGVGMGWEDKPAKGERYEREEPTLFGLDTDIGKGYEVLMDLAGRYAYAGRDDVVQTVLDILGTEALVDVHNHHNFAWREIHGGEEVVVIRKGATPLFPGQQSFIGGSMTDLSVIVEGIDSDEAVRSMRSTVHGAGRVMGRMQAKGKECKRCKKRRETCAPGDYAVWAAAPGQESQPCDGSGYLRAPMVTQQMMDDDIAASGIELRGAGLDESAFVYRRLPEVLAAHSESTRVRHHLRPVVVCMAGADVRDPYKD